MSRTIRVRPMFAKVAACDTLCAAQGDVAYVAAGSPFLGSDGSTGGCAPPGGRQPHIWIPGHRCSGGWLSVTFAGNGATGPSGPTGATGATGATGPLNPAATTFDGQTVTKLPTPTSTTSVATLYSANGLTMLAECDTDGNASLAANGPATADAELTINGYDNAGSGPFGSQANALGPASLAALGPPGAGKTIVLLREQLRPARHGHHRIPKNAVVRHLRRMRVLRNGRLRVAATRPRQARRGHLADLGREMGTRARRRIGRTGSRVVGEVVGPAVQRCSRPTRRSCALG